MAKNDVVHIEDDQVCMSMVCMQSEKADLRYKVLTSLSALIAYLEGGNDAGVWVVDGNFPAKPGGPPSRMAESAIGAIREARRDAKIILYTSDIYSFRSADLKGAELVSKLKCPADSLVAKIRQMLGKV